MFPRSARPCCIYKLRFPVGCDGGLKRFLQNKPSVEEWKHVPSALKERERESVQMAGEKRGVRQKKLSPLSCQAQFPTCPLCLAQLALWEENGSPWSAASCPSNPSEHQGYLGFMDLFYVLYFMFYVNTICVYSTSTMAALHFLEETACLVSPSQTYPRDFVVL